MGKFHQLSQALWPFIDVEISFPLSILSIFDRFSSLCMIRVDIRKKWFGIEDEENFVN